MIQNATSESHRRILMHALERARMRLAVAIASETKSMPRSRWLCYLDTADQIRRLIKRIRGEDFESPQDCHRWVKSLERLEFQPIAYQASRLCEILREIARHSGKID